MLRSSWVPSRSGPVCLREPPSDGAAPPGPRQPTRPRPRGGPYPGPGSPRLDHDGAPRAIRERAGSGGPPLVARQPTASRGPPVHMASRSTRSARASARRARHPARNRHQGRGSLGRRGLPRTPGMARPPGPPAAWPRGRAPRRDGPGGGACMAARRRKCPLPGTVRQPLGRGRPRPGLISTPYYIETFDVGTEALSDPFLLEPNVFEAVLV